MMTTQTKPVKQPCGSDQGTAPQKRDCLPCDLPPFCRNHYYTGKLLTERDFQSEQRYFLDKARLHHLALHGWGVVCGLRVTPHPYCPDRRLIVEPGLAIDSCGREIRLVEEVEILLPEPPPPLDIDEPCPPDPDDPRGEEGEEGDGKKRTYPAPGEAPEGYDGKGEEDDGEKKKPKPPEPCKPEVDLYVCLRYAECATEFAPAPFDECACQSDGQQPNRICEGFEIELLTEKPEGADEHGCCEHDGDCIDIYRKTLEPCPAPKSGCLVLAVIAGYEPGQEVSEDDIDNLSCRRILPSTDLLDQLIRCIICKLPAKEVTQITDLGWTHGGEYSCHDFMKIFIGDEDQPKHFEITFGAPIRPQGLSTRSFQAVVVRHREKGGEGGYLEVAPAKVWTSDDHTKAYLRIDPEYAEHCLHGNSFDLFLKLRCDVIVDERGCAIDGNLQASLQTDGDYVVMPPTGNGLPGGLFESWIEVLA